MFRISRLKQNLVDAVGCQPLPCRGAETLANAFLVFGRENGDIHGLEEPLAGFILHCAHS